MLYLRTGDNNLQCSAARQILYTWAYAQNRPSVYAYANLIVSTPIQ